MCTYGQLHVYAHVYVRSAQKFTNVMLERLKGHPSPPSSWWVFTKLLLCQGTLVLQQVSSLGMQHVGRILSLFVCRIRECLAESNIELIFCTTFYMQQHARS